MKIFNVSYDCPGATCYGDIVICEQEADISKIIAERKNISEQKIEKLSFFEISPEEVRVRDLTVGDFLRLIGNK